MPPRASSPHGSVITLPRSPDKVTARSGGVWSPHSFVWRVRGGQHPRPDLPAGRRTVRSPLTDTATTRQIPRRVFVLSRGCSLGGGSLGVGAGKQKLRLTRWSCAQGHRPSEGAPLRAPLREWPRGGRRTRPPARTRADGGLLSEGHLPPEWRGWWWRERMPHQGVFLERGAAACACEQKQEDVGHAIGSGRGPTATPLGLPCDLPRYRGECELQRSRGVRTSGIERGVRIPLNDEGSGIAMEAVLREVDLWRARVGGHEGGHPIELLTRASHVASGGSG